MKLEKKKATTYNDLTSLNAKVELIRMNLKTLYVNSLIRPFPKRVHIVILNAYVS